MHGTKTTGLGAVVVEVVRSGHRAGTMVQGNAGAPSPSEGIEPYRDRLRAYAAKVLRSSPDLDPDDAVAELGVRALAKGWPNVPRPMRWLFKALGYICREMLRRRRREQQMFDDLDPVGAGGVPGPPEGAMHNEIDDELRRCVDKLPPVHRDLILDLYYNEKTVADIARKTETPDSTLRSQLHKAHDRIRACLKNKGHDEDSSF